MTRLSIALASVIVAAAPALLCAEEFDHTLFAFKDERPAQGWRLNIWGKNAEGEKGAGGIEAVAGRRGGSALRLHTANAGKHNFISPDAPDGPWRKRTYAAVAVWYRGDGSKTNKGFQIQTRSQDGKAHYSYSARLYLGSTEWRRVVLRSFWRRKGTPALDLSRLRRIHIGGTGTHEITIGEVRLLAAGKPVHLEATIAPSVKPRQVTVHEPELTTIRDGLHMCRVTIGNDGPGPAGLGIEAAIQAPGARERLAFASRAEVDAGGDATVTIAMPFETVRDGKHRLMLMVRDAAGRVLAQNEYEFHLLRRTAPTYTDIVLWPPPQVWELQEGYWLLPARPTLSVTGQGDAFPAEHLAERLERIYGTPVNHLAEGKADLRLEYVAQGVKPEGFVLDVGPLGVHLRAADGRGMYYGIRALLDVICQSSLGDTEARCRRVHCEDWPACPTRIVFHRIDDYYQVSKGVQTYKDFIYDQVAGGRYNLLILNCRGGVRYDTHPELSRLSAFKKSELREILDFARRHYVDVAPGGNSPGHAAWIGISHKEMREDGDANTLCTRHPDSLPILRDVYGELIDLFQPTRYFHLGGDEVRWKTSKRPPEERCTRCKGMEKRELLLEHWTALIEFCKKKGVRPILWEDMLSPTWNGGEPHETAEILARLPKGTIIASWGTGDLVNAPQLYRKLGLTPWKINTSYAPSKMESFPSWWRGYDALGIAEFMPWPWCNFIHYYGEKTLNYTTPAVHCCAACNWKPEIASYSWHELVASQGLHWMKVMRVTEWGTRRIRYAPLSIAAACNDNTLDEKQGAGNDRLRLELKRGLRAFPSGRLLVGAIPFKRPAGPNDCVVLRGEAASLPIEVGRRVRGLAFLHTAAASEEQIAKLCKRFFRKNTSHYGMPIASYRVRYADGQETSVPVKLGWNVHFWDCYPGARVMPGARAFWAASTHAQNASDSNAPDACAWSMEWKNPKPDIRVESVAFVASGTEATVVLLGITAVE